MTDSEKQNPVKGNVEVDEGIEETEERSGDTNNLPPPQFPLGLALVKCIPDIPPEALKRIKALKKIQMEMTQVESQFFKEMHDLEVKYSTIYTQYFEKRREIVLGNYEPDEAECDFPLGATDSDTENLNDCVNKLKLENEQAEGKEAVPGIPDFWLTIFNNVEMLSDMVQEYDVPILKHLTDIKVAMTSQPMGFQLFFHFSNNEYFTDQVLTKTYEMKCEVDPRDPFSFEGPEIIKCAGCKIDWNKGKNVTIRVVRKKQKHKQRGSIRMVSKTEEVPSFFDFFNPPEVLNDGEVDEETQIRLTSDFELGQYIRERIVPRAVLYFTGEALEDDYDEEEEEDDDDDDDDDDDETEDEDDGEDNAPTSEHGGQDVSGETPEN